MCTGRFETWNVTKTVVTVSHSSGDTPRSVSASTGLSPGTKTSGTRIRKRCRTNLWRKGYRGNGRIGGAVDLHRIQRSHDIHGYFVNRGKIDRSIGWMVLKSNNGGTRTGVVSLRIIVTSILIAQGYSWGRIKG